MNESLDKFAYKCLPLNVANQYGWSVLSPCDFKVSWYGGGSSNSVEVFDIPEEFENIVSGHFGSGTFTINVDFIIKTPKGYSLYVRGVPNKDYGIVQPLDAIVETDWLPFTFTYNFKFIDSGVAEFKKGEELFSFFPIKRDTVENFSIHAQSIREDSNLERDYLEFTDSRMSALEHSATSKEQYRFQRFYLEGRGPSKSYDIKSHIKRLFFKDIE